MKYCEWNQDFSDCVNEYYSKMGHPVFFLMAFAMVQHKQRSLVRTVKTRSCSVVILSVVVFAFFKAHLCPI